MGYGRWKTNCRSKSCATTTTATTERRHEGHDDWRSTAKRRIRATAGVDGRDRAAAQQEDERRGDEQKELVRQLQTGEPKSLSPPSEEAPLFLSS